MNAASRLQPAPRICQVCGHRQHPEDPTRHVCAGVLRQSLRKARAELGEAQAKLERIGDVVGGGDPVAAVLALRQEHNAALAWAEAAHERGYRAGLRLARALIRRLALRVPFGGRLLGRIIIVLSNELDMKKIGGK